MGRSVCTVGITASDLYPTQAYDFVTGISDASQRVGVYSTARYLADEGRSMTASDLKESVTVCLIKTLCRETLKLCGLGSCHLVNCLMNPIPEGPPDAVRALSSEPLLRLPPEASVADADGPDRPLRP